MAQTPAKAESYRFTLGGNGPDLFSDPRYWEGCLGKRIIGYVIDLLVLASVWFGLGALAVLSLGLLSPLTAVAWVVAPLAYHTLLVHSRGATIGQKLAGIRIVDARTGDRPSLLQAFVLTVGFYFSVTTLFFVPLLYALFDSQDRLLHDIVSSTRTVRAESLTR